MRFSVKRLLWAFAVWSGAFALLHSEMPARNLAAVVVATSLAGVVLLVRSDHVVPIVAIALGAGVGVALTWLLRPGIVSKGLEESVRVEIFWTCLGALGGSLFMRLVFCLDPMLRERERLDDTARVEE